MASLRTMEGPVRVNSSPRARSSLATATLSSAESRRATSSRLRRPDTPGAREAGCERIGNAASSLMGSPPGMDLGRQALYQAIERFSCLRNHQDPFVLVTLPLRRVYTRRVE